MPACSQSINTVRSVPTITLNGRKSLWQSVRGSARYIASNRVNASRSTVSVRYALRFRQDFKAAENGSPMHPDSVTTWLDRFSKRNGLPHINPHKFRHTMASMLIFNHVDPVSVSKRLGHSSIATTQKVYLHIIKEMDNFDNDIIMKTLVSLE